MHLKKAIVKGFKSFAHRTEFEFSSHLTAVVGPNGCGKSNIVDAVRWALGEQSARALRGGQMSDIIFSGSDNHPPARRAEVSLFIDNSQGDFQLEAEEVQIKRSVDQSGQSQYYLNGKICRLLDIRELLLDKGLHTDGYALIGQGEVEDLILASPTERRQLFEEASGILKIRASQEEAEARLREREQDLQRIRDLINELRLRVPPLRSEAERAEKYRRYLEEKEEREINLLLEQWLRENKRLRAIKEKLEKREEELERAREELEEMETEEARTEERLEDYSHRLSEAREGLQEERSRLQETSSLLDVKQEQEKNLKQQRQRFKAQQKDLKAGLSSLKEERSSIRQKIQGLREELSLLERGLSRLKEELEKSEEECRQLEARRERLTEEHWQEQSLISDQEMSLDLLVRQGERLEERLQEIDRRQAQKGEELSKCSHRLAERKKQLHQLEERLESRKKEQGELEKELEVIRNGRDRLLARRDDLREREAEISSRLKLMMEMRDNYSGYYPGVKAILREKQNNPDWGVGVHGVVARLVEFAPRLRQALAAALGARSQNIVVARESHARQAVKYLRKNSLGRATFLPVETIKTRALNESEAQAVKEAQGILGPAVELVEYPVQVKPAILHLLGRVVLAEDLDQASLLAARVKHRLKLVTLEGDIIFPGGAITGGSNRGQGQNPP